MKRKLVLGVVAVVILAGVSLAAIELLMRPVGPSAGLLGAPAAEANPALSSGQLLPGTPGAPESQAAAVAAQQWRPPPAPVQELLPQPPKGSWEEIPVANLRRERTPEIVATSVALQAAQTRLSACFDEDTQARFGPRPITTMDYAPADDTGQPMLMLEVESRHDEVVVVDAPVEAKGNASDGLIACAQSVLRGLRAPAPGARPGKRTRMRHLLTP